MLCYKKIKVALLFVFLMGCEFQPLYGTRGNAIITGEMKFIEVRPISDRMGQTLRNHLIQNFKPLNNLKNSRYVLNIQLSENKQNLAIKKSEIATRANLIIIANYQIVSKSSGELLSQGSSQMITSYYALDYLGASSSQKTISTVQEQLANDGFALIRNFFSVEGLNIFLVKQRNA